MFVTILTQLVLLVYHQAATLCDFFPFNGVRFTKPKERRIEALVNFVLMVLPPIGFWFRLEALMSFGLVYYFILFAVEGATWWAPYALGPSQKWLDIYTRVHSKTITVVPRRGFNPAPNIEHLNLMVLTLAAACMTLREFKALHPGPLAHSWIGWAVGIVLTAGTASQMVGSAKTPTNVTRANGS
jgi:hypothetical protein